MARHLGIALRILLLLSRTTPPGVTRREIRQKLGLPEDTEITARIRELRDRPSYGDFDVQMKQTAWKEFRYCLPSAAERRRARKFVAELMKR